MDYKKSIARDTFMLANEIARSYKVLSSYDNLHKLIQYISDDFNELSQSKFGLHKYINDYLLEYHVGEMVIKGVLVEKFTKEIFAFEVPAISSRLDFLIINGNTHAYEIKSKLDKLDKVIKQLEDYHKLFEYVNLVIDPKHLSDIETDIPEDIGIYIYERKKLKRKRKAKFNENSDAIAQLNIFTQKELKKYFGLPKSEISSCFSASQIRESFRTMLKKRYTDKTKFLTQNLKDILLIDYQYFFKNNIEPSIIYS